MSDTTTASAQTGVRPFRIEVPEREIEELLWRNLEEFTGESLFPVARRPTVQSGGIPDIVALNRSGDVVVVERFFPPAPLRMELAAVQRADPQRGAHAADVDPVQDQGAFAQVVSYTVSRSASSGFPYPLRIVDGHSGADY